MKYLGIDYGSKRVGLAMSDDSGTMAFPKTVLNNTKTNIADIITIILLEKIEAIVIGFSADKRAIENPITQEIKTFAAQLSQETSIPVYFESEHFSSVEAFQSFEKPSRSADPRNQTFEKGARDDSAAAIILQRYLDKRLDRKTP